MRRSLLLAFTGVLSMFAARPGWSQEAPPGTCTCERHPESTFNPNPQDPCCTRSSRDNWMWPWVPGQEEAPPPVATVPRRLPPPPPPVWQQAAQPPETTRVTRASLRPWKWTTLTAGLVLAGGGAALLALDGRVGGQCWMPGDLTTCKQLLQTQPAGAALVGVGAASLVSAVVLFAVDARRHHLRPHVSLVAPLSTTYKGM